MKIYKVRYEQQIWGAYGSEWKIAGYYLNKETAEQIIKRIDEDDWRWHGVIDEIEVNED